MAWIGIRLRPSPKSSQCQGLTGIQGSFPYTHRAFSCRVGARLTLLFLFSSTCSDGPWHNLGLPIPTCDVMRNSRDARGLVWPPEAEREDPVLTDAAHSATALSPEGAVSHTCILITLNSAPYSAGPSLQGRAATWLVLPEPPVTVHLMHISACFGKDSESSQVETWAHWEAFLGSV